MMVVGRCTDARGDTLVEFSDGLKVAVMCSLGRCVVLLPSPEKEPVRGYALRIAVPWPAHATA